MLASRLYGTEDIRLDDVPDVVAGDGEVRLKVAHNGICGSDLHMYFQGQLARSEPFTIGHEFAGVVDQVGPGVTGIALGTPVAVRPFLRCDVCDRCTRGLPHLHTPMRVLGCGAEEGGGLAEYCVAEAQHVVRAARAACRSSRARSSSRWRCRTTASAGARSRPGCAP